MMQGCDWQHMLEDGSVGGILMAIVWGFVTWWKKHKSNQAQSQYQK